MIPGIEHIPLALTPVQRWSAARRLNTGPASDTWFVIGACVLLIVLVALLVWVSYKRRVQSREQTRELFAGHLRQRGLGVRERQILLAIAMRSGLRGMHDIFSDAKAFDHGADRLLAECSRARTPQENAHLELEVNGLRQRLGFRVARAAEDAVGSQLASSRDIPLGKTVELTRRGHAEDAGIRAEVVRNDEIELAVELKTPVASGAGEVWRIRYCCGMSAWELETSTVSCEDRRLILNHSNEIRFAGHREMPRVTLHTPALMACFPFLREGSMATAPDTTDGDGLSDEMPNFVEGVVTEMSGSQLRIEGPLQVAPGDRVLTLFRLAGGGSGGVGEAGYTVASVGRVGQCLSSDPGMSMVVELTDLSDVEMDKLADIMDAMSSRIDGSQDSGVAAEQMSTPVVAAAKP